MLKLGRTTQQNSCAAGTNICPLLLTAHPPSQHSGFAQHCQATGRLCVPEAAADHVPCSGGLSARRLGFSTNWHCSSWGSCSVRKEPCSCLGQAQCFEPWGIASRMWLILIPKGYSCPVQKEIPVMWAGLSGGFQNFHLPQRKSRFCTLATAISQLPENRHFSACLHWQNKLHK